MTSSEDTGSAFIGFYPSEDPVIAFSGFIEHGEYSKFMIKQIIEAYYDKNYKVVSPTDKITDEEKANILADTGNASDIVAVENEPAVTEITNMETSVTEQ